MRKYRSTSGLTATMERIPYSRNEFQGSHVYTEVVGPGVREHRYNWNVNGDFGSAFEWLVEEFGCGWTRVRYK